MFEVLMDLLLNTFLDVMDSISDKIQCLFNTFLSILFLEGNKFPLLSVSYKEL